MAPINDKPFRAWEFAPDTWQIDGVGAAAFLVLGKEKALMIDTGMSRLNIREFVETLTDLPIMVANTHGHFDHTGGNGFFDEVYMSAYAATEAKSVFKTGADVREEEEYPLDYEITVIEEGYVFDLGGRRLEAIAIPCHSPGSFAYLDMDRGMLFSGDEIDPGQVLLMSYTEERKHVQDYLANMAKLKARENEFTMICPAHNGCPITSRYVDLFIELGERIIAGEEGSTEVFSSTWSGHGRPQNPNWRRMEAPGGTAIVYDQRDYPLKK